MKPCALSSLKDADRLRELANTELMDSASEERFDRYTRLAARLLKAPVCLISLVDERRQFFKSSFGLDEPWASQRETPLSHSFCRHAVASGQALVVRDARCNTLVRDNGAVRDMGVIAYAGFPLSVGGHVLGAFSVIDKEPREWSAEDLLTLRSLAETLATEIEYTAARREIRQHAELLHALTDSELDAIVTADEQGNIVFCNRATETLFMRSREELLGRPTSVLMPERYRDSYRAGVARLRAGKEPPVMGRVVKLHGVKANGEEFPVELSLSRVGVRDGFLVTAVIRDISERSRTIQALREAEERFRLTIDDAPIGMALVAPSGQWLRVNDALCKIVGYSSEELLEVDFQRITHPDDLEVDLALVEQLLLGTIPSYTLEKRYLHRDGHVVWIHLSVSLVRDPNGEPRFFISQIQDITARLNAEARRARAEQELREKQLSLSASLEEREVLLQEVQHRVKNNLQVISSLIGMQARGLSDRTTRSALQECRSRVEAIALIHEQLFAANDYARVPFAEYVKRLATKVFLASGRSPAEVALQFELEDVAIPVDKAIPCGLIVNELITNSLKHAFAKDRQGHVRVALHQTSPDSVALSVCDDGIGCSQDSATGLEGALGFPLIATLAEQLEGRFEITQASGNVFRITFPIGRAAEGTA